MSEKKFRHASERNDYGVQKRRPRSRRAQCRMWWCALLLATAVSAQETQPTAQLHSQPPPLATDVSRANTPPPAPPPPPPPPPYDLKASASDYAYTYPVSEYAHAHFDHFDHSLHAHSDDHPSDDEYKATPRDIAFGFLTFLVILSNLQGALINLSKNNNMVGIITTRKRRGIEDLLEDKQVRCVQHSVCSTNYQLSKELGLPGRILGKYLNKFMARSVDARWARFVADAGAAGLSGVDCSILYRGCQVPGIKDAKKIT
ncbi:hypothetical protein C0J52_00999 [Blattella germanica]|nr:hypothetical protein C0J52_00999 [Blattella germanica]